MNPKLKTVICILLFAPIWLLLCTILHEGGHALVILAYGGTIDRFWVLGLNAHVSAHGGVYSVFGEGLKHAAGVLLPMIVSAIAFVFYKPKVKLDGYHYCYFLVMISSVFTLLVWIILPILSLFRPMPQGEDVMQFISATGFHPLLVSAGALLLVGTFVLLMFKSGLLKRVFGKAKMKQ